jgi:ABC-2 type transport system permease protein
MNTFKWLLKREYWEHRGGLFWAPLVTSAIFVFFSIVGLALVGFGIRQFDDGGDGLKISEGIAQLADPSKAAEVGAAIELLIYTLGNPVFIVMAFVGFFYCLGSLYDDRKDRSILFWKSLPISDVQTVASKVFTAAIVVPAVATAGAVITSLLMLMVLSVFVLMHGENPIYFWDVGAIARASFNMFAALPIYALWALPTIGWLMMCSAWSKRVPFIWAILIPVLSGIMVWMLGLMDLFGKTVGWFWGQVVLRVLSGTLSGTDIIYRLAANPITSVDGPQDIARIVSVSQTYSILATPELWIGVVLGAAMIGAAIYRRRATDEG